METLYHKIQLEPSSESIKELEDLIKKYPHVPKLYNYLFVAYAGCRLERKAKKIMLRSYKKHPTYLFAKINYAEHLINHGDLQKVPDIFDKQFDLSLLYPKRKVFHETEVVSFYGVLGYYYIRLKEFSKARHCLKILNVLSSDHGYTARLAQLLAMNGELPASN